MKICPGCKINKPMIEYHINKYGNRKVQTYCKPCQNAVRRKSYQKHRKETIKRHAKYGTEYFNKKYKIDPVFKLSKTLRSRLYSALKKQPKTGSAIKDLGCSSEELKLYIESKFQPGMTWNNWSRLGWHIDHIKPISSFDLSDYEQLKQACHYTNLQPLWCDEHKIKTRNERS